VSTDETEAHKQIVNGAYSANTLTTHLRNPVWKKRDEFLMNQWFPLQDNAQPHFAHLTTETSSKHQWNICRMAYSPDLAACDFWAFPVLKHEPQGQELGIDTGVKKIRSRYSDIG
jgi:hypothetical protein